MRLHDLAALAMLALAVAPAPVLAGDSSQSDRVELALTLEVKPAATGGGLQPSIGAAGSSSTVPSASAAEPVAGAPSPKSSTAAPAATSDADPSQTSTTEAPLATQPPVTKLVVVGWGGAYGQALRRAVLEPFRDNTRIEVESVLATSALELPAPTVVWDVADVSPAVARQACESGAVAPLDTLRLSPGAFGAPAQEDFIAGSLGRCAVASFAWSSLVLIDPKAFRKGAPQSLADVFDGKRFKQKRAFARTPRYLLEMALLADGVPPVRVYGELSTRDGLKRAFKKLDGIRKWIVWSDKPDAVLRLLGNKDVGMATAFSGRAFYVLASELKPYRMIWDGQIYDLSVWVVSSRSTARQAASDFIAFATRADRLAAVSRWFPYGPVRLSALELVGAHPTLGMDLQPFLPTAPANMTTALPFNELFWRRNEAVLMRSLEAWIAGKDPLPPDSEPTGAAARSG